MTNLKNVLTVADGKKLVIGYVEPMEAKNKNIFGFRTVTASKTLANSIANNGLIYPLLFASDEAKEELKKQGVTVRCFPDGKGLKDGQQVTDGEVIPVESCDFIGLGGRNRLLSCLSFGKDTLELNYVFENLGAINQSNIQLEQSNGSILAKVIGAKKASIGRFSVKKAILAAGVNWSSSTLTNNVTSIKDLLHILDCSTDENKEFLEQLIFSDQLSFNMVRQVYNSIPTNYKNDNKLTKLEKDSEGKTVKNEDGKAVVNEDYSVNFSNFLCDYLKFNFKTYGSYSTTKTKVVNYVEFLEGNKNSKGYKIGNFDKKTIQGLNALLDESDVNIIKLIPPYLRSLPKTEENDKLVEKYYDENTGTFNTKSLLNLDNNTLSELYDFSDKKEATKYKSFYNKIFKVTKVDKETTKIEISEFFDNFVEITNIDNLKLLSKHITNHLAKLK